MKAKYSQRKPNLLGYSKSNILHSMEFSGECLRYRRDLKKDTEREEKLSRIFVGTSFEVRLKTLKNRKTQWHTLIKIRSSSPSPVANLPC